MGRPTLPVAPARATLVGGIFDLRCVEMVGCLEIAGDLFNQTEVRREVLLKM